MKTILYMAMSANGYIAKADGSTPWSDNEWKAFSKIVQTYGNIVIGKNTYDIMCQHGEFAKVGNPFVVVVSHSDLENQLKNVECAKTPKQALEILQKELFDTALIAGGGTLNASFLNENLIDEMYLDVEPFVFINGIDLFVGVKYGTKLKLLNTMQVGNSTVQYNYITGF